MASKQRRISIRKHSDSHTVVGGWDAHNLPLCQNSPSPRHAFWPSIPGVSPSVMVMAPVPASSNASPWHMLTQARQSEPDLRQSEPDYSLDFHMQDSRSTSKTVAEREGDGTCAGTVEREPLAHAANMAHVRQSEPDCGPDFHMQDSQNTPAFARGTGCPWSSIGQRGRTI